MKNCPWCQKPFSFIDFITRYGTDTLVRHRPGQHPREHICQFCHKKFWVFYNPKSSKRLILRNFYFSLMAGLFWSFFIFRSSENTDLFQILKGTIILVPFLFLPALAYAKYQTAHLKQEK